MALWKMFAMDAKGEFTAVTNDGYSVTLPWAVAVELLEGLDACLADHRRGRVVDGVAWCASCGHRSVDPEAGEDTCWECIRRG